MLVLLNIQLESVTGAADHRVVGFKLKQAFFGKTQNLISADDAVLGGFQECQPYLHFKEGD